MGEEMSDQRTNQQRKAMEVYFRELAEALNDAGFEMKAVLEVKEVDVPWTQDLIKNALWRTLQLTMFDKGSTTELSTSEVDKVYEVLNRHIGTHFGVHVPFPSIESQSEESRNDA